MNKDFYFIIMDEFNTILLTVLIGSINGGFYPSATSAEGVWSLPVSVCLSRSVRLSVCRTKLVHAIIF